MISKLLITHDRTRSRTGITLNKESSRIHFGNVYMIILLARLTIKKSKNSILKQYLYFFLGKNNSFELLKNNV